MRKNARRWPSAGHLHSVQGRVRVYPTPSWALQRQGLHSVHTTPDSLHCCILHANTQLCMPVQAPQGAHCFADADGSHVPAHLDHHAAYLVAGHKRQLRTVLVESLEEHKVVAVKRIACRQRASRAEIQAQSNTACLSGGRLQPYITHTAASERQSITSSRT